jgi:hypothetical protein
VKQAGVASHDLTSWRAGNLVGIPEQVAEKIKSYVDLGCTGIYPWCPDYPDTETVRLFGGVADHLRGQRLTSTRLRAASDADVGVEDLPRARVDVQGSGGRVLTPLRAVAEAGVER